MSKSSILASRWLGFIIIFLLIVGGFFNFFNLDKKVYWHDEVYTSMRAAGFTRDEIDQELFQNRIVLAPQLQKYQNIKRGSTAADTIKSLAVEDPQHPPLYFLIARFWMQAFGNSLAVSRTLPVLFNVLALPLMYGLALELFASPIVARLATALLAVSPFDTLFAQTARQYSLLTAAVIGSSFLLLRALRLPTWQNWGLYTLVNIISWYTHPFFGLTVLSQGVYVLLLLIGAKKQEISKSLQAVGKFFLAVVCSLLFYLPWLIVLITNYQRASATTDWTKVDVEFIYLVKMWILSFTSLFLDLDFGFDSIWTYLMRSLVLLVIGIAIFTVYCRTSQATWLFILTSIFVPFFMLVLPDLLLGGKRSAVSRYLISCYPGIQLAVAYLLATKVLYEFRVWRGVMLLLMSGAIASCTVSAFSDSWWNKDLSYFNPEVIRRINATSSPIVISEIGDDFTNTGDLISMSYLLHNNVSLLLLSQPPQLENVKSLLPESIEPFVFRPSKKFIEGLKPEQGQLVQVFPEGRFWQIKK